MKLTQPIKLDAATKAARRAYQKGIPKAVRKAVNESAWRCSQGYIFRELDGWFIDASLSVNRLRHETRMRISVKPMQADTIFWDIVGMEECLSLPLSFRLFGAWTCPSPVLFDEEIAESDDLTDLDDVMTRFLSRADGHLGYIQSFTVREFLGLCLDTPRPENFLAAQISALVIMGEQNEARALCEHARKTGHVGGFSIGRRQFPDLAIDWLNSKALRRGIQG